MELTSLSFTVSNLSDSGVIDVLDLGFAKDFDGYSYVSFKKDKMMILLFKFFVKRNEFHF